MTASHTIRSGSPATPGNFYGATIQNLSAMVLYFSLFNGTPGALVLLWSIALPANSITTIDDSLFGTFCSTGFAWVVGDSIGATSPHSTAAEVTPSSNTLRNVC